MSAKEYTVTVTATDSSSPVQTGSISYLWTVNAPPTRTCSGTNGTDVTVPDAASASSTITISGCPGYASSTVKIEVHLRCGDRAGLTVTLGAPDASSYTLYSQDESGTNLDHTFTWNLSSEVANGTWRLRVIDNWFDSDVAVIDSWTLTLAP
jgi:subtilisin-like proprotein convertase family protein